MSLETQSFCLLSPSSRVSGFVLMSHDQVTAANTDTTSAFKARGRHVGTVSWPLIRRPGKCGFSFQPNSGGKGEDDSIMCQRATMGRNHVFRNGDVIKINLPR